MEYYLRKLTYPKTKKPGKLPGLLNHYCLLFHDQEF